MTRQDDRLSRTELRALARRHTRQAYETLLDLVRRPDTPPSVRKGALKTLIERGFLKGHAQPDDPAKLH
jgi:hypothetical protein